MNWIHSCHKSDYGPWKQIYRQTVITAVLLVVICLCTNEETNEEHEYKMYAGVDMQYFLDNDCYYQSFPYVPFELDTTKIRY